MVTNEQVKKMSRHLKNGDSLELSAAKSGMSVKTARKYRNSGKLPSEVKVEHTWQTREDPFAGVWDPMIKRFLEYNPCLEGKVIFNYLQREFPDKYQDGQLRTLQRRIKNWRATEGPPKEVYFCQDHHPGDLCASDFTHMDSLGITIKQEAFQHMIYHFVLTYSNWETGSICFSESLESLTHGFESALWELGGVPHRHRTDRMSAAVNKPDNPEEFTRGYQALLNHYGIAGEKIQARKANENGDVEQSHYRFKQAVDQSLILRGNRDFSSEEEYLEFLRGIFRQLNSGRQKRFKEELKLLKALPCMRLSDYQEQEKRVSSFSLIRVARNSYSVDSRLIGEKVKIRLYANHLEVWYGQKLMEKLPRLKGKSNHLVQYRHIIDWLVRKPGAFENYHYKKDLFPSTYFRIAYDFLSCRNSKGKANKEYLKILYLAARESESRVEEALRNLFKKEISISSEAVEAYVKSLQDRPLYQDCQVTKVNIEQYDALLTSQGRIS
jgi:hypothetical protein